MSATGRGRPVIRLLESECPALDLGKLLAACRCGSTNEGAIVWFDAMGWGGGRVDFQLEPGHLGPVLRLAYNVGNRAVAQEVPLQSTMPTYGGRRWWFTCPMIQVEGHRCLRRVAKLYMPPGHGLGCRTCHRLVYRSSRESHK